jgi:hypothetical protein
VRAQGVGYRYGGYAGASVGDEAVALTAEARVLQYGRGLQQIRLAACFGDLLRWRALCGCGIVRAQVPLVP